MVIFPVHPNSMNQRRGMNTLISDRWDLTLECIRRHYAGEDSPLSKVIEADKAFYDLFVDFKGYVDFFLLQDCVSGNYSSVNIWMGDASSVKVDCRKQWMNISILSLRSTFSWIREIEEFRIIAKTG